MSESKGCSGRVHNDYGVSFYSCSNRGKHQEGGKWWCGIHLPSKMKARRAERDRKFTAEWEAKQRRWGRKDRVQKAEKALVEGCLDREARRPTSWSTVPGWLKPMIEDVRKARAS